MNENKFISNSLRSAIGILFLLAATGLHANTSAEINTAVDFLAKHTWPQDRSENLDVNVTEQHLSVITKVLEQKDITTEREGALRALRGYGLSAINFIRLHQRQLIDVAQAEQALQDFNFAIEHFSKISPRNLQYEAGHVAKHLLQSNELALQYWHSCAEKDHGGCMNILAHDYFVGAVRNGANINAAVKWHNRVYNTTSDFTCAGIFSANRLAQLSYYLPDVETGKSWLAWQEELDKLYQKIRNNFKEDMQCNMEKIYTSRYVMQILIGPANTELLQQAQFIAPDENTKAVIGLFAPQQDLMKATELLDRVDSPAERCTYVFDLANLAKHYRHKEAFKQLEDYLSNLAQSDCRWDSTLMQQLQMKGQWDIEN
jgi:hypothetical protein